MNGCGRYVYYHYLIIDRCFEFVDKVRARKFVVRLPPSYAIKLEPEFTFTFCTPETVRFGSLHMR